MNKVKICNFYNKLDEVLLLFHLMVLFNLSSHCVPTSQEKWSFEANLKTDPSLVQTLFKYQ